MRFAALGLAVLLVAGCTPDAPAPAPAADAPAPPPAVAVEAPPAPAAVDPALAWENRLGNLPPDVAAVVERIATCTHFSGEINGDQSERDREVAATMAELHCDTAEQDAATLREQYGDRPDVLEALAMALDGSR
jgi:hypothetical protein